MTWLGANNRAYTPPQSLLAPSAVINFQQVRQGDTTNGSSSGTQNGSTLTIQWGPAIGFVDHHVIQRRGDYGSWVDYATVSASTFSYTDTAATNAYFPGNVAQPNTATIGGQTTIYDYQVFACADAAGLLRGPAPAQFSMPMYQGALAAAWSASTAYTPGNEVSSGGINYVCWVANTNQAPPNGTYWVALTGGAWSSGFGSYDLSFGFTPPPAYTDTTGSPVGGGFDISCTKNAGDGQVGGLQYASGTPLSWNYGAEVGCFNYLAFDLKPGYSGQDWDCAAFSRAPPGDVTSHVNLGAFATSGLYGPTPVVGSWATYKIPLSALMFSTPGSGITTFTGSIASGVLTVSAILSGPGLDAPCWIAAPGSATTPGASAGVWISSTPGQTGTGTYNLTMGLSGTPPNVTSQTMTARRTNFYKTAIKDVHGAVNNQWFVNNILFLRN